MATELFDVSQAEEHINLRLLALKNLGDLFAEEGEYEAAVEAN